jgi:hypothetical protein
MTMRILIAVFTICLFSFSCEKEDANILPVAQLELNLHAIAACGGEFDLGAETPEAWGQRLVDALTAEGITIYDFEVRFEAIEHPFFCGNCAPTGDILSVQADTADESALRELGFVD